jgi:hypothetical protein
MTARLTRWTGLLLPLAVGCVPYTDLARTQASAELRCPEERIEVDKTTSGFYEATGCGQRAKYQCWDDAPPAETPAQTTQRDYRCSLVDSSMPKNPAAKMSESEANCRVWCDEAASSCRSGCADNSCASVCLAIEDGCHEGCRDAERRSGGPGRR